MRLLIKFILILLAFAPAQLSAQIASTQVEFSMAFNARIINLGKNGIAIADVDESGQAVIARIDDNATLLWKKNFSASGPGEKSCIFGSSADGKDLYLLRFDNIANKGGGKNPSVTWINAVTGENKEKKFTQQGFGHVITLFANSKYLFIYTSQFSIDDNRIESEPGLKLFRFDKQKMEMAELSASEMNQFSGKARVFWQVARVEENYFEAYQVKEAGQHMVIAMARFDNEGKKTLSSDIAFDLKQGYSRQVNSNMPPAAGVNWDLFQQNYYWVLLENRELNALIYPTASCYLTYCPETGLYIAYGLIGPGEQKNAGTKHTGIFAASIDTTFKLKTYREHNNIPELTSDKNFSLHDTPHGRYINGYAGTNGQFILSLSATQNGYLLTLSQSDLSLKQTLKVEEKRYAIFGNHLVSPDQFLVLREEAMGQMKKSESMYYIATASRQYGIVIGNGYSKSINVLSEKIK